MLSGVLSGSLPLQERSIQRLQDILDATAGITERDGIEAVNPTAIAY